MIFGHKLPQKDSFSPKEEKWTSPKKFSVFELAKTIESLYNYSKLQATIECRLTLKRVRDMIKTYSQIHSTDKYSQHSSTILPVCLNGWVFACELSGSGFDLLWSYFRYHAIWSKEFLEIQATVECRFTLRYVSDMIRNCTQMHCTNKHPQHSSIIWPVWLNGWVFV